MGGSWTLVSSEPDRYPIGSQVLHPGTSGTGLVSETTLACAYSHMLFDNLYKYDTGRTGYHVELKLTAQVTSANNNQVTLYLNNIATGTEGTWSSTTFRKIMTSDYFKVSDIVLETTSGYSQQGCNLTYTVTGLAGYSWQFWDVTLHAFMVEDEPTYKWKRTA